MPDTTLITQLDQLRDYYVQQQKTTNNLISGLKNASAAWNKLNRAMGEYAPIAVDADHLTQAQQALLQMPVKVAVEDVLIADLRQQYKALTHLIAALKESSTALQSDPVDVIKLDRGYAVLQNSGLEPELLAELEQELQRAQEQLGNVFGAALHERLAELGVEMGGRAPRFEAGRFEIVANFISRKVSLNYGKMEVTRNIPISIDAVIRAYQTAVKHIMGRNEDGEVWIKQFKAAYENARRLAEKPSPRVNIVDCYFQLVLLRQNRAFGLEPSKHTISDYTRPQFMYDFVRFRNFAVEGQQIHLHVATKSQTDTPSKSMWMVDGDSPHAGYYVADIEFTRG